MQVGSIVECINGGIDTVGLNKLIANGYKAPVQKQIYTVREIHEWGIYTNVLLEEIINNLIPHKTRGMVECGFSITRFRELSPPAPIEELIGDALTAWTPEQEKEIFTAIDNDINGRNDRL